MLLTGEYSLAEAVYKIPLDASTSIYFFAQLQFSKSEKVLRTKATAYLLKWVVLKVTFPVAGSNLPVGTDTALPEPSMYQTVMCSGALIS
ncbi:MAG TPA: hypothetical protein VD757_02140 [Candidatus Nitrosocosmicus sp.]|nr:hypothetical protein [Candidatus Nitrosocosmicus sp.]